MTDWRTIFGHETPYEPQVDGIETAIEVGNEHGYLALEGACGTGKTMLAVTAGLSLVRDESTSFERVLVLTSVKQQLRQFEAALRTINENLPAGASTVTGLTLVGKADVCPYAREERGDIDPTTVYDRCEQLRERTRGLTSEEGTTAGELVQTARRQQIGLDESATDSAYLETAGAKAPYPPTLPETDTEFCPFYAQYLADRPDEGAISDAVPFDHEAIGLLDAPTLIEQSVTHGTCPHSMMGALIEQTEVLVGNYYHVFDPRTAGAFTGPIIDESTFLVCDEAHMLEPRVRDLLGDRVARTTLQEAAGEIARLLQPLRREATEGGADVETVRSELIESQLTADDLADVERFLQDLADKLDALVEQACDRKQDRWTVGQDETPPIELPLRDPATPAPDAISQWITETGREDHWQRVEEVCAFVTRVLDDVEEEPTERAATTAGRVLGAWRHRGHEQFFRTLTLTEPPPADGSERVPSCRLTIHNCVPSGAIGEQLAAFGGGILMSATLAPMDVFTRVTGLDRLAEQTDRPVETRQYGLQFPNENRASFAVDAPKFTYQNRGDPTAPADLTAADGTDTRAVYADILQAVARSPGNVLVGMPSYREAEWAATVLERSVDKPVLVDEASSEAATQSLKDEFFAGEGKVLVTSLRGTLTEGVDYDGDRLNAAVVCGVPIVDTASPQTKAVRAAYDRTFGTEDETPGFRYALTIPAVRKARQAIGRVIRGPEDCGVRVLVDQRYARRSWDSVREYLPDEFRTVSPDMVGLGIQQFWADTDPSLSSGD